uniref:POC5 n=1 Tax=Heterorhabditis bacteriophora TaxID=37862 RepID=A0A1I7WEJ6_HETBA
MSTSKDSEDSLLLYSKPSSMKRGTQETKNENNGFVGGT